MNIYLLRHGQKTDDTRNHDGIELSEKGVLQAELLGSRLKGYQIEKIYSSNMKRALQTAECIDRYLNVGIIPTPDLREIHMGACEIDGWGCLVEKYPDFISEYQRHEADLRYPPNGECGTDVWVRASRVIREIIGSGHESVAVVTHGGVIRVLISGFLKLDQSRRFLLGAPPECCSISMIKYLREENAFYIHTFNDYAHLECMDE